LYLERRKVTRDPVEFRNAAAKLRQLTTDRAPGWDGQCFATILDLFEGDVPTVPYYRMVAAWLDTMGVSMQHTEKRN
jgi:hypothetical protein